MLNAMMLVQAASESGLTLGRVVHDIPHDMAAMVVYVMVLGSLYLIWRGSRPKKRV